MNISVLLLLILACAALIFPLCFAIHDLSSHVLSPPERYTRKYTPNKLIFPTYEHQLYMQKLEKRSRFRQRFFHI